MKSDVKSTFGANFRHLLKEKKISQAQIAKDFDLTATTLQRWINGKAIPNPDNLDKLADYLEVEVAEFFIRDIEQDYNDEFRSLRENYNTINGNYPVEMWNKADELARKYSKITGEGSTISTFYAEPVGRILPGISHYVIELLQMVRLKDSDDEAFYHVCILLHGLLGDKAKATAFHQYINADEGTIEEYEFRKKKLARVVCKIAGLPSPTDSNLSLADKLKFLSPIEMELIEHSLDDLISKKNNKKSVS